MALSGEPLLNVAQRTARLTRGALAAPLLINGCHVVAETGAEKGTIAHDAERRPLHARVGREL